MRVIVITPQGLVVEYADVTPDVDTDGYLNIFKKTGPNARKSQLIGTFNSWSAWADAGEIKAIEVLGGHNDNGEQDYPTEGDTEQEPG